jgi:hypothetical protein
MQSATDSVSEGEERYHWHDWAEENGIVAPKLSVRAPTVEERGKGGVHASESISAMEVIARIPRKLVLSACDASSAAASQAKEESWAAELTAAALLALHPTDAEPDRWASARREWIGAWVTGGWATDNSDLGKEGVRWGASDVTGSLLATGSDNDKNIYAKFRFPCHPVVHRAALGLSGLVNVSKADALAVLEERGRAYRAMREALIPLVTSPTARAKGSVRDRRSWDVADALSRVLSRATYLQLGESGAGGRLSCAVVPLHERLAQCDGRGENAKLVGLDPLEVGGGEHVLLVASRDIAQGEPITRDYDQAPALSGDSSTGALRRLTQFGLPPAAWGSWLAEEEEE